METRLIDVSSFQKEFHDFFGANCDIGKFNTEEMKLQIKFNYKDYNYSYELKKGAMIKRELIDFNIDFATLQQLDTFMKQLMEKIFVAKDIDQMSIYDAEEKTDLYGS